MLRTAEPLSVRQKPELNTGFCRIDQRPASRGESRVAQIADWSPRFFGDRLLQRGEGALLGLHRRDASIPVNDGSVHGASVFKGGERLDAGSDGRCPALVASLRYEGIELSDLFVQQPNNDLIDISIRMPFHAHVLG